MDFEENLRPTSTIVFAFSSRPGYYEFRNTLQRLGVSHVLLQDGGEGWYQDAAPAAADYFRETAAAYARSVALGLSKGAYAALLFGHLTPVSEIIALSPVTGVGVDVHPDFDEKWFFRVHHAPNKDPIMDLKPLFACGIRARVQAFVGNGIGTELDIGMAERIGVRDIEVVEGADHASVARVLRDNGWLAQLIKGAC